MYLLILIVSLFFSSQDNLDNKLNAYLKSNLAEYKKIDYEIISLPRTEKNDILQIDNNRSFKLSGNIGYVPVIINNKSGKVKSVLTLKLKLYGDAFLASRTIHKGEVIKVEDFNRQTIDLARVRGEVLSTVSEEQNARARLEMKEGSVLTAEYLEALPVIHRGDKVTGFVQSGNVSVSTDVIAQQDGIENSIIRVSAQTNKIYKAKVIDSISVQIIE